MDCPVNPIMNRDSQNAVFIYELEADEDSATDNSDIDQFLNNDKAISQYALLFLGGRSMLSLQPGQ